MLDTLKYRKKLCMKHISLLLTTLALYSCTTQQENSPQFIAQGSYSVSPEICLRHAGQIAEEASGRKYCSLGILKSTYTCEGGRMLSILEGYSGETIINRSDVGYEAVDVTRKADKTVYVGEFGVMKVLGEAAILRTAIEDIRCDSIGSTNGGNSNLEYQAQAALKIYDAEIEPSHYTLKIVDLNDDGLFDALALMKLKSGYCGSGGCSLLTLITEPDNGGVLHVVGNTSLVRAPVLKLTSITNGFHDLSVYVSGGGHAAATRVLKFDGRQYTANASMADKAKNTKGVETLF